MGHKRQLIEHRAEVNGDPSARRLLDFLVSAGRPSIQVSEKMALTRLLSLVDRFEWKPSRLLYDEILLLAREFGWDVRNWIKNNLSRPA